MIELKKKITLFFPSYGPLKIWAFKLVNRPGAVARSEACLLGMQAAQHARGPKFDPHIISWRLGHENISKAILPLLLIQEEQLSVTGERMCTKYW